MKLVIEFDLNETTNHAPSLIAAQVIEIMQRQMRHRRICPFDPTGFDSRALEKHGEFILMECGESSERVFTRALIVTDDFDPVPRAELINDPGTKMGTTVSVVN